MELLTLFAGCVLAIGGFTKLWLSVAGRQRGRLRWVSAGAGVAFVLYGALLAAGGTPKTPLGTGLAIALAAAVATDALFAFRDARKQSSHGETRFQ